MPFLVFVDSLDFIDWDNSGKSYIFAVYTQVQYF